MNAIHISEPECSGWRLHLPLLEGEPHQCYPPAPSHVQCFATGWEMAAARPRSGRNDPKKQRGSSELGKEPAASSRRTPRAFQLGLSRSRGLCYKAAWEKEGINAPKAVLKSTLRSSCSFCYLILIIIEVFFLVLPGVPRSPCACSSRGSQPRPARTHCDRRWPLRSRGSTQTGLYARF